MRALAVIHQRDAGLGIFAEAGAAFLEWIPAEAEPPADPGSFDAVIVLGGAMDTHEVEAHPWLEGEKSFIADLLATGVPILGVCLGSQLLAEAAGTQPRRASRPEIGWHEVELTDAGTADPLTGGLPERFEAFQWHSYETPLPAGAVALAHNPVCLQAYRLGDRPAWGIQFHAEVDSAIVGSWLDDYRTDPDAVRLGIDPEAVRGESRDKLGRWNDLGRDLARRFVAEAAALSRR